MLAASRNNIPGTPSPPRRESSSYAPDSLPTRRRPISPATCRRVITSQHLYLNSRNTNYSAGASSAGAFSAGVSVLAGSSSGAFSFFAQPPSVSPTHINNAQVRVISFFIVSPFIKNMYFAKLSHHYDMISWPSILFPISRFPNTFLVILAVLARLSSLISRNRIFFSLYRLTFCPCGANMGGIIFIRS